MVSAEPPFRSVHEFYLLWIALMLLRRPPLSPSPPRCGSDSNLAGAPRDHADPLIVDAFIAVHSELSPTQLDAHAHVKDGFNAITRRTGTLESSNTDPSLDNISSSTEEMLVLYDLAKSLSNQFALDEAADIVSKHLRRIVPATTCVFFIYDPISDELRAAHATGDNATHFSGLSIPRGQRLSGWVAANLQTILNSDPILDLGEAGRHMRPRLHSCLSTALVTDDQLVGVLSLYSIHRDGFNEDHRRIVEVVARQVSQTIRHTAGFDKRRGATTPRDKLGIVPSYEQLEGVINSELASSTAGRAVSIVWVRARNPSTADGFSTQLKRILRQSWVSSARNSEQQICFAGTTTTLSWS